jgi:acetyl-CoA acetyltransferase
VTVGAERTPIAIAGVGETAFLRAADRSLAQMLSEASRAAIADAGLEPGDIDGFITQPGLPPLDEQMAALGVTGQPFMAACDSVAGAASVGVALQLATMAITTGYASAILVPYGIKCSDPGGPYAYHERDPLKADLEMPVGWYGQAVYFGAAANRYAYDYGLSEEELASVSISARKWAERSPNAQRRDPLDLEGYRKTAMIATPFRAADCCLMTDGACAYVVTSLDRARELRPGQPVVRVAGVGLGKQPEPMSSILSQNPNVLEYAAQISSADAYAEAGVGPDDLDFAQIYDCFSISTIIQVEQIGLAQRGEGGKFFAAGHAGPGGRMPVNTSGGHMSGGYLPGANLMVEAVRQLRGERGEAQVANARCGAVTGLSGNVHATAVLMRED